jgi:dipeptidyl aminopeptidase/acylaminoacyl peptidase
LFQMLAGVRDGIGRCGSMPRMPASAFDLDTFLSLPRLAGLAVSPDGRRLVTGVAELAADGTRHVAALWEVDTAGEQPARRLTRSDEGETAPLFTPDGSLLFTSARPVPDREDDIPALWRLPAGGGEALLLAAPAAGVLGATVARGSGTIVLRTALHPDAGDLAVDAELDTARTDAKVTAQLIEHYRS